MADVTPTGPLAVAVDALRTLIANVPFFQTWTGSASAAAALASIYTGEVGYPIAALSIAAGVMTIQTRETHGILAGSTVTIQGASTGDQSGVTINGTYTVFTAAGNSFAVATALADLAAVYPDEAFVFPGTRPLAVICESSDGLRSDSIGTGGASVFAGALGILLEADVSAAYANDERNALYEARNAFGSFIAGLQLTAGTGDLMVLNKIEPVNGPEFTADPEQDGNTNRFERWRALVKVTWGLEG